MREIITVYYKNFLEHDTYIADKIEFIMLKQMVHTVIIVFEVRNGIADAFIYISLNHLQVTFKKWNIINSDSKYLLGPLKTEVKTNSKIKAAFFHYYAITA